MSRTVASVVEEAHAALVEGYPDGAAQLVRARKERPTRPTVVVVGETKRGKSSLINALVNVPDLSPVDPQVATSTYIVVTHGPRPRASAQFPGAVQPAEIGLERLRDWATGNGPPDQPPPRMIEVEYPSPLLINLSLVDTPGVGGLNSAHGEIALRAAQQATALLFVVDASAPFSQPELAFLQRASETVDTVLFALTKVDAYRGWRQIAEDDRALLRQHAPRFSGAEILPVSSLLLEQAGSAPSPELAGVLRTESQIAPLQLALQTRVAAKASVLHDANLLRTARTELAAYFRQISTRRQAVDPDPGRVEALKDERERLVASRRSESRTWQLKLRAEIARARMDSMHDVQREIRESLHYWRSSIDAAGREELKSIPEQIDANVHAMSLRVFDRVLTRLRSVVDTVLKEMFAPEELADVYAGLVRQPLFDAANAPEVRAPSVEDRIVLFGGFAAGMGASRLMAYLPMAMGLGAATVVVAPISIGLGLAASAWMVRSRRQVAEKNHLKIWIGETLTEARATMEAEVGSQFIDAEHTLTLALDAAIARRIEALDTEIRQIDDALRLNAQEKDRLRQELTRRHGVVREIVGHVDEALASLRVRPPANATELR